MAQRGGPVDNELAGAVAAHQGGRLPDAERMYRAVLQRNPTDEVALTNLGIVFAQTGRMDVAVKHFQKAVETLPKTAALRVFLGNALKDSGRFEDAVKQYTKAIRLDPAVAYTSYQMGNCLLKLGRAGDASVSYEKCVQLEPNHPDAWLNLGIAYHQSANLAKAVPALRRSLELNSNNVNAWWELGDVHKETQEFDFASNAYESGLKLNPNDAEGWSSLADCFREMHLLAEALAAVDKSLKLRPNNAKAHYCKGTILQLLKRGVESVAAYSEVIRRIPDMSSATYNIATIFADQGKADEARSRFEEIAARKDDPSSGPARIRKALVIPVINESVEQIAETRSQMLSELKGLVNSGIVLDNPQPQVGTPAFYLAYQGGNNAELMTAIGKVMISCAPGLEWTAPHCLAPRKPKDKLKIGFISMHLKEHTVGLITAGLIEKMDRNRFEVVVMHPMGSSDAFSQQIDQTADSFLQLPGDYRPARELIAQQEFDAIYYPDVGMDPFTYFLSFSRLAHAQFVGWGHADTTGVPNMDYYISSRHFEPGNGAEQYSEKLMALNRINCYLNRPSSEFLPLLRSELNLPERVPIYSCPQSAFKLHPEMDEALRGILEEDKKGVIALSSGTDEHWNDLLMHRFRRTIPDHVDRIRFIPRVEPEKFIGLMHMADAIIDPKHFTGGYTSYIAFAYGLPVVTWDGDHMRGRMTRGLYSQMDMRGPVAKTAAEFATMAVRLANDPSWKEDLRSEIREKSDRLFSDIEAVREFEAAIERGVKERS